MAGREFGPPPFVVQEFDASWRNWLFLLFRKVYKRTFFIIFQAIDGIGDGNPSNTLQEGLIGIAPVMLGQDNRRMNRNYSGVIPSNWVQGTDFDISVTFANVDAQTGSTSIVTEINYGDTALGEDLSLPGSAVTVITALTNNAAANLLQVAQFTIMPSDDVEPGHQFQFELARDGADAADTCSGDVGYVEIYIQYQGFINHE